MSEKSSYPWPGLLCVIAAVIGIICTYYLVRPPNPYLVRAEREIVLRLVRGR